MLFRNEALMADLWDDFVDLIEKRKKQLDEVLEAYVEFREKLDALPPEIAQEVQKMLTVAKDAQAKQEEVSSNDLAGKTALECVRIILRERKNEPTHFSAIAREALRRGYKGRMAGTAEEVQSRTASSFWAAMSRAEDLDGTGKGCYRLRDLAE
jgi:hypothetical protein